VLWEDLVQNGPDLRVDLTPGPHQAGSVGGRQLEGSDGRLERAVRGHLAIAQHLRDSERPAAVVLVGARCRSLGSGWL